MLLGLGRTHLISTFVLLYFMGCLSLISGLFSSSQIQFPNSDSTTPAASLSNTPSCLRPLTYHCLYTGIFHMQPRITSPGLLLLLCFMGVWFQLFILLNVPSTQCIVLQLSFSFYILSNLVDYLGDDTVSLFVCLFAFWPLCFVLGDVEKQCIIFIHLPFSPRDQKWTEQEIQPLHLVSDAFSLEKEKAFSSLQESRCSSRGFYCCGLFWFP